MLLLVGRDLFLVVRSLLIQLVLNALIVGASALAKLSDLCLQCLILCFKKGYCVLQIGGLLSELLIFALSDQGLPLKIAVLALVDGDLRRGQVVDFGVEPDAALALAVGTRERVHSVEGIGLTPD